MHKNIIAIVIVGLILGLGGSFAYASWGGTDGKKDDNTSVPTPGQTGSEERFIGAVLVVRALAAEKTKVSEDEVSIVSVTEQDFSDSCLGLGGPAESCLQVITPGYEVTVSAKGEEFVYRTNMDGSVVREGRE